MNLDLLRQKDWIVFECVAGSHAYCLNIPESDIDIRGVFVLPTDEVLAGRYIPQVGDDTNDTVFYEFGRFLELAAKGNPNILELLFMPDRAIVYKAPIWDEIFDEPTKNLFLTKRLKYTFGGFAFQQLKKADGYNKKINWETSRMERKSPSDFCYAIDGHRSTPLKDAIDPSFLPTCGVVKVPNGKGLYAIYFDLENTENFRGLENEEGTSNTLRLSEIPKEFAQKNRATTIWFNEDGYSVHCKDYKSYQTWLKERNEARYAHNMAHGQNIDSKNMLHVLRIVMMLQDFVNTGKLLVDRTANRDYLLSIRRGEVGLDALRTRALAMLEKVESEIDDMGIPAKVPPKVIHDILLNVRKKYL